MKAKVIYIIGCLLIAGITAGAALAGGSNHPCVTCISSEAVYVDGGLASGINIGDTLAFIRDRQTVAIAVVTRVAELASAAEVCHQKCPVQIGDVAALLSDVPRLTVPVAVMAAEVTYEPDEPVAETEPRKPSRLKGSLSVENFYRKDMTDSDLDRAQPGLRTRLSVTNLGGGDLEFKLRHRSRLYHRSRSLSTGQDTDEWVHRVYELGLFRKVDDARTEWALGRVLSPYVRGVGYVDGGYIAHRIHDNFKLGVAGGTTPDRLTSEPDFDRRKFGLFLSWEIGEYATRRVALTAALSSEYDKTTVSRDFIYFQGTYSKKNLVSLYQSVEIDLNRDWRYDRSGERFTFTNYYGNATVNLSQKASVFFSYDARKNIRYVELMDTPDSLFNDDVHKGIRGGFNLRPSGRLYFRSYGGIRFREDGHDDNRFISALIRIDRFPMPRHAVTLSMHLVETQFTTGYRPMLRYRLPVSRRLTLNLTGSGYIYKTGANKTSYYFADVSTYCNLGRRYFFSGNLRHYFDSELESVELRTELGVRL